MNDRIYRFQVGDFDCLAIRDGRMNYPVKAMFSNVPLEEVNEVLRERNLTTDNVMTPYTCLFVDTGDQRIMIDTGAGTIGESAHLFFPGIDNADSFTGELAPNLVEAGIDPATVDTVIITHAHPDHVAGTLIAGGNLAFPEARYLIAREETEFWRSPAAEEKATDGMIAMAKAFMTLLGGRLTSVAADSDIAPGVTLLPAPGHTPGHTAVSITSGGQRLLHVSDTVLHPLHLACPEWLPVFDIDPDQAAASKRHIFDLAAAEQALVFAHHFPPFPNLGYVTKSERGWLWQPIQA